MYKYKYLNYLTTMVVMLQVYETLENNSDTRVALWNICVAHVCV